MIRLLILGLLFFVAYTFASLLLQMSPWRRRQHPPEKTPDGAPMVQDSQCGTYVPRDDAVVKTIGGEKHYFCSKECRDAYLTEH